jgi:hypothetical protein
MTTRLVHLVVDAAEPARLARFWAAALRWEVGEEDDDEADVGQGDAPWQVLADPEGNEFCVLSPR